MMRSANRVLSSLGIFVCLTFIISPQLFCQTTTDIHTFCEYSSLLKNTSSIEKSEREKLYLQLVGILSELEEYRDSYLKNGKFINIFPSIYFHVTAIEMNNIRAGLYMYPTWKMYQMITFYEAYALNRQTWDINESAEPHWKEHFRIAEQEYKDWGCKGEMHIGGTLNTAIEAHVKYDLPRSIRYSFDNNPSSQSHLGTIKAEFDAINESFKQAENLGLKDITNTVSLFCKIVINVGSIFYSLISKSIVTLRTQAWNDALNKQKVIEYNGKSLAKQPYSSILHDKWYKKGQSICHTEYALTLFLFDVSGSMSDNNKWQNAKQAATSTLDFLFDQSGKNNKVPSIGLFSYSGECIDNPTTRLLDFSSDKSEIKDAINDKLPGPGGATPTPQAIKNAEEYLKAQLQRNNQCEGDIIILTDGQSSCGTIRPPGTYNQAQQQTVYGSCQAGTGSYLARYQTIGFDIPPGSDAEKDLQYLSSAHGGKYYHADNGAELKKAFEKISRIYVPIFNEQSTSSITAADHYSFTSGIDLIQRKYYDSAFSVFKSFVQKYPKDSAAIYNYALMSEATDQYKIALKNYTNYLQQNPLVSNRKDIEEVIAKMTEYYKEYFSYQKAIVTNDAAYLNDHFKKLMNGQSIPLATEFTGFIKEKPDQYEKLPGILGTTEPLILNLCKEVSGSFKLAQKRVLANAAKWDQDAVPVISILYLKLEKLSTLLAGLQVNPNP